MSKLNNKQAGGTLLGLIFGLIIGLAIAVVVAIMITKTPTPFTNKTTKSDKAPDAITTPPASTSSAAGGDQLPDPNKSLYGNKDASKEDAKVFAPPAPDANNPPVAVPPASAAAEKNVDALVAKAQDKSAPVVDKSTADKTKKAAGDIAEAKTKAGADDNWIYFLQVGAFREQTEAENAKARLALMGFEAKISERQADTGSLYRVRIGPLNQLETMNRIRGKLSDNGVNAAVVRAAK